MTHRTGMQIMDFGNASTHAKAPLEDRTMDSGQDHGHLSTSGFAKHQRLERRGPLLSEVSVFVESQSMHNSHFRLVTPLLRRSCYESRGPRVTLKMPCKCLLQMPARRVQTQLLSGKVQLLDRRRPR